MKCLTWNLEWASPASKRLALMREMIDEFDPDVICYTEVIRSVLLDGHVIEADADYGYPPKEGRRKVILWSKTPWTEVDPLGDTGMPTGRFVSGVAEGIRFVGVCIPWKDAHVNTGRRNRKPWEDHLSYCAGLKRFLHCHSAPRPPVCVLGDYNQRIPRATQPQGVVDALRNAIPSSFSIVTEGLKDASGKDLIDHITVSPCLHARNLTILPRFGVDGRRLSDHVGVAACLEPL